MNSDDDPTKRSVASDVDQNQHPQAQDVPLESIETQVNSPVTGFTSTESGFESQRIGNYKLLQIIGEGGMGAVWMADQTEPVKRRVALKLIKTGRDSKPIIARFEAERQALALMDHPCIAKILDGGTTDFGQPYFVMELVAGIPITQYCDQHRLSLPERLGLFTQVCNAIQHAHQKGIIHRDLKPANILVGVYDGKPVPKVIDFGLAKALDHQSKLTDKTLFTEFGAVVGTLQYMSPEQADLDAVDIDTRADIYALGVLLYELLTGSTPIEVATLKQLALLKVLETIRDTDPPRPSARLSSSSHQLPAISGNRQIDPSRLQSELRGDLDWIVMKALEKDRSRRYESASGFAADIERYLTDQPVVARPPTATYKLGKFFKKNRGSVIAAGTMLFLLLTGLIGTSLGLLEANRQTTRAQKNLTRAEAAEAETKERVKELEEITAFQTSQLSDIDVPLMGIQLRRSMLDQFQSQLTQSGKSDQEVAAEVTELEEKFARLNFVDVSLDLLVENVFMRAEKVIEDEYKEKPLLAAALYHAIGISLRKLGRLQAAEHKLQKEYELRTNVQGTGNEETLNALNSIAVLTEAQGKFLEAEQMYRKVLAKRRQTLGNDDQATVVVINNLATSLSKQSKSAEAEPLFVEALETRRRILGNEHPDTLASVNNLAYFLTLQGDWPKAKPLHLEVVESYRRILGDAHPNTLAAINNMAIFFCEQGNFVEAEPLYSESLAGRRRILGSDHPDTLSSINNVGYFLDMQGKFAEAEPLYRECLAAERRIFGDGNPSTMSTMYNLATNLFDQSKLNDAEPLLRKIMEDSADRPELRSVHLRSAIRLANLLNRTNRNNESIDCLVKLRNDPDPRVFKELSDAYCQLGQRVEALTLAREFVERTRNENSESPEVLASSLRLAARALNRIEDFSRAEPLARESLELAARAQVTGWELERIKSTLGVSLLGLGRRDEARPFLETSSVAIEHDAATIPIDVRAETVEEAKAAVEKLKSTEP